MDISLTASILTSVVGRSLATDIIGSAASELVKRLAGARKKYEEKQPDPTDPLEVRRQELLSQVSKLQYDVVLTLSDSNTLVKTLPVLLDVASQVYGATSLDELRLVDLTLDQVRGALENYREVVRRRAAERRLAVGVTVLALAGLAGLVYWGGQDGGPTSKSVLPIVEIPLPVLVWSAIGSFVAMLYRFNSTADKELRDPVRWLVTRPVVGVAMGTISYFIVKLGLLSVDGAGTQATGTLEVVWLVAFLAGFSDRFAESLLRSLVGRFGGEEDETLLMKGSEKRTSRSAVAEGLSSLANWSQQQGRLLGLGLQRSSSEAEEETIELDEAGEGESENGTRASDLQDARDTTTVTGSAMKDGKA